MYKWSNGIILAVIVGCVHLAIPDELHAQCVPGEQNDWVGGTTLWSDQDNWFLNRPPDADDDVIFAINSSSIMNLGITNGFGREILSMDVSQIGDLTLEGRNTGSSANATRLYSLCDFQDSTAANAYTVRLGPADWVYIGDPEGTSVGNATTTALQWDLLGTADDPSGPSTRAVAILEMAGTFGCADDPWHGVFSRFGVDHVVQRCPDLQAAE